MNRGGRGRGGGGGFRGGRGRGGGGGASTSKPQPGGSGITTPDSVPMDMVRPVLPPLYPDYSEGVAHDYMDVSLSHLAADFVHFNDYLRNNYSVHYLAKVASGFEVDKYTDTYDTPLRVQPNLHYVLDKKFFPKELYAKSGRVTAKKVAKVVDTSEILEKYTVKEEKRDSDSEDSDSEKQRKRKAAAAIDPTLEENLELKNAAKSLDPELGDADDDEEDEADEEMDDGNDYQNDYFDNGEGYLSEDDALEEGDVF